MQFTLRDVLIKMYDTETADRIFYEAGKQAGREFCKELITRKDDFNEFVAELQELLKAREQEYEMQIAKEIQMSLLPTDLPELDDVALAGLCVPAHQIGGDYYDFISREQTKAYDLIIADVSGHNIGSALIMAEARTYIHSQIESLEKPAEMLEALNRFFFKNLDRSDLFVTMFYLQYRPQERELCYTSAGHNTPLLWRKEQQQLETLDAEGLIFGIKQNVNFEQKIAHLAPGDLLLLYTDGIIEAEDNQGEFFGLERLGNLLQESGDLSPQEIIDSILNQVRIFTGMRHFNDDITLVVVKFL
jgi:serine phosphatase RsbU (regulator of sigma subunit)